MASHTGDYGIPGWLFGSLVTMASSLSATCGNMLMKKAQLIEDKKTVQGINSARIGSIPYRNPYWVVGFICIAIIPCPLEMLALSAAGESIVYPIGAGLTIVFLQLLAPIFLGERLTKLDIVATTLIVIGVVFTIFFGTHSSIRYSITQLLGFWHNPIFLAWFIFIWTTSFCCIFFWKFYKQRLLQLRAGIPIVTLGFSAAVLAATQGIMLKNTSQILRYIVFEEKVHNDHYENPLSRHETYFFFVAVPVVGVLQIIYLNYGLQYFPAVKFIPVYNTLIVITAAVTGALYFQEYTSINPVAFPIGLAMVCTGILLLLKTGEVEKPFLDDVEKNYGVEFNQPIIKIDPLMHYESDSDGSSNAKIQKLTLSVA